MDTTMSHDKYEWDNVSIQVPNRIEKSLQDFSLLHDPTHNNKSCHTIIYSDDFPSFYFYINSNKHLINSDLSINNYNDLQFNIIKKESIADMNQINKELLSFIKYEHTTVSLQVPTHTIEIEASLPTHNNINNILITDSNNNIHIIDSYPIY